MEATDRLGEIVR